MDCLGFTKIVEGGPELSPKTERNTGNDDFNPERKFRFTNFEPESIPLEAAHDGYREAPHRFHIARQNLTRRIVAMLPV